MTHHFNRRDFLTGVGGTALAYALDATAQTGTGPRTNITVRIDRDLAVLDPADRKGPWDGNVIRVVHQRLMKQKPNSSELELDAAAEVKQVSPTVIEFRLKPGQMFTDGFGEMTADDVKFSFERIGLPAKDAVVDVQERLAVTSTGVEVKSKYEGRIVLSQPRANLFDVVIGDVSGCIVSKKAVEQRGADIATKPVGSGPYQLVSLERQKGAVLRATPRTPGASRTTRKSRSASSRTPRTTDLALRSGELDFAILSPSAAEPLRSVSGLTLNEQPSIAYVWLGMNVEKAPFTDMRVRQAIRLALDVDQMLTAGYNGKAPRLNTLLPPQILGHWREAPVYKRNVAEAKSLLAAAGASNLKLKLLILNQAAYQNMALVARALLADVGDHGRGRLAGRRHVLEFGQGRRRQEPRHVPRSASTASTIRISSCSGSSPSRSANGTGSAGTARSSTRCSRSRRASSIRRSAGRRSSTRSG